MQHATALATLAASSPMALVDRDDLAAALNLANLVIERRNTIPIHSNVLLAAAPDGASLMVTGTDLDIETRAQISAAVDPDFSITLPARDLRDLVKKAKAGTVTITEGEERATLDVSGLPVTLPAIRPDEFPDLWTADRDVAAAHYMTIDAKELADALAAVAFAISAEEKRYYLNGVFMHYAPGDNVLRFVACDGHRLARRDVTALCEPSIPGVILPAKTVKVLLKHLGKKPKGKVKVTGSVGCLMFDLGDGVRIASKLIDGTFPDYERVIPKSNSKRLTVGTAALAVIVDQVMTVSLEKSRAVKLTLGEGKIMATVNNPDAGTASATVPCEGWPAEGDGMEIGLNGRFVLDQCAVAGATMELAINDPGSPVVFTSPDKPGHLFVLMPMRL